MDVAPPPRDTPLFERFRVPGCPEISPERIADAFGMEPWQLAEYAQVPPATPETHPADDALQAYLNEVLDVLEAVHARGVPLHQAIAWFMTEPLSTVDGRTAHELVAGGRLNVVLHLLEDEAEAVSR